MKLFLLIFCLVCISITTAQECTRKNDTYTYIAKPLKTKTAKRCTAKCEKSSDCVSWTWNKKDKRCYLIREFDLAERTPWISGNCGVGACQEEGLMKIGVTCGSGVRRQFCFLCGDSFDSCQGTGDHPDCIFTSSDNCIPNNRECVTPFRPGPGPNGPNSLCYYFSNILVNAWEDAENRCQSMSSRSYLAFIETQAQQDFIVKVLDATTSDRVFIGGTSRNNTDLTFYWLFTSTAFDDGFTFWGPGEPNYKDQQCMEMNNEKGKYPEPWMWNNIGCGAATYAKHSYVCVYDRIRGGCRTGWMEFGGRCYYVAKETKKLSWDESVAECKKLDERSDLPSVGSQLEQDYIAQYAKDGYDIFLGATDKDNEGQWKWTDGRPWTYTKWAPGEPNNDFGGTEHCAYMRPSKMKNEWNDRRCFKSYENYLLMCSYNPGSSE